MNAVHNDYYKRVCGAFFSQSGCMIDIIGEADEENSATCCVRQLSEQVNFYLLGDAQTPESLDMLNAFIEAAERLADDVVASDEVPQLQMFLDTGFSALARFAEIDFAVVAAVCDHESGLITYASFGMPDVLLLGHGLIRLSANNPRLSGLNMAICISSHRAETPVKLLIRNSAASFDGLEGAFISAFSAKQMQQSLAEATLSGTRAYRAIFVQTMGFEKEEIATLNIACTQDALVSAQQWYEERLHTLIADETTISGASFAFGELMLNALEHGCLGISGEEKHRMLESGEYWDELEARQSRCTGKIGVTLYQADYARGHYLLTVISDEGKGFDTAMLGRLSRPSERFNGRGIYISEKYAEGLYFNAGGNSVLSINHYYLTKGA